MRKRETPKTLLVILLVIVAGIVGYFLLTRLDSDETTNWRTYRSEQYGIEFQYPADWKVRILKEENIDSVVQVFSPESYAIAMRGGSDYPTDQFAVRILHNKDYENIVTGKEIILDGKKAIDRGWEQNEMTGVLFRIIKVLVDPSITIEISALSTTSEKVEEQMLSTFKLIP